MEYVDPSRPLIAHPNNPFLQPKTPISGKIVHMCTILGVTIICSLLFYVLFINGAQVTHDALVPAPLPTGSAPKNAIILNKSATPSAHILQKKRTGD